MNEVGNLPRCLFRQTRPEKQPCPDYRAWSQSDWFGTGRDGGFRLADTGVYRRGEGEREGRENHADRKNTLAAFNI